MEQFGYAKVCVERGQGRPPVHCCVTVYIRKTEESLAVRGEVYPDDALAVEVVRPQLDLRGQLSQRECAILQLIAEGLTDKEIAATLNVSVRTAENHAARIRQKLKISGRTNLARFALRHHIAEP